MKKNPMPPKDPLRPPPRRCGAKTRTGDKCQQYSIIGGTRCRMHGGGAPQVKAKAEETLQEWRMRRVRQLDAGLDALLDQGGEALAGLMVQQPSMVAKFIEVADRLRGGGPKVQMEHSGEVQSVLRFDPSKYPKPEARNE